MRLKSSWPSIHHFGLLAQHFQEHLVISPSSDFSYRALISQRMFCECSAGAAKSEKRQKRPPSKNFQFHAAAPSFYRRSFHIHAFLSVLIRDMIAVCVQRPWDAALIFQNALKYHTLSFIWGGPLRERILPAMGYKPCWQRICRKSELWPWPCGTHRIRVGNLLSTPIMPISVPDPNIGAWILKVR